MFIIVIGIIIQFCCNYVLCNYGYYFIFLIITTVFHVQNIFLIDVSQT